MSAQDLRKKFQSGNFKLKSMTETATTSGAPSPSIPSGGQSLREKYTSGNFTLKTPAKVTTPVTTPTTPSPTRQDLVRPTSTTSGSREMEATRREGLAQRTRKPTTSSGIKARIDHLNQEIDRADEISRQMAARPVQYWNPSTLPTAAEIGAAQKREEQKKRHKAERDSLLGQYYTTENLEKWAAIQGKPTAAMGYLSIQEADSDREKLGKVMGANSRLLTAAEAQEIKGYREELKRKYGITDAALSQAGWANESRERMPDGSYTAVGLERMLLQKGQEGREKLEGQGYRYDRMAGFKGRVERAVENEKWRQQTAEQLKDNPAGSAAMSALTVGLSPFQGLDLLAAYSTGSGSPEDPENYVPMDASQMGFTEAVNTIRSTVANEIKGPADKESLVRNALAFLYNTGMSVADSAAQVATLGPASIYFMGASSAANTTKDIIQRGGTNDQAFWGGLAAGAAEALFERVSIDQLLRPKSVNTWKDWLRETAKQAGTEASEETFTEIANILADAAILGDNSETAQAVAAYKRQGMTDDQARRRALLDNIGQVALAGLGGAISGGFMGGTVNAFNRMSNGTAQNQPLTTVEQRTNPAEGVDTPAVQSPTVAPETAILEQQKTAPEGAAVKADTTLFKRSILQDLNQARTSFIEFARHSFPSTVKNVETGREIGISRKGLDKFLSGRISYEKYATGFHIPELIERARKVAQAPNNHIKQADSIPTYEYYDSPIEVDGINYMAHIRVRNTLMGDKYYGHTISEIEDIKIEPSARTSVPGGDPAVQPVNAVDDGSMDSIPQPQVAVNPESGDGLPNSVGAAEGTGSGQKSYRHYKRESAMSEWGHAMFADDPNSLEGWTRGDTIYTVNWNDLIDIKTLIPQIEEKMRASYEMGMLPEWWEQGIEYGDFTIEDYARGFAPNDIADSAGAWDNDDMVSWFYENFDVEDIPGIKTPDGAIVFNESIIQREDDGAEEQPDPARSIVPAQQAAGAIESKLQKGQEARATDSKPVYRGTPATDKLGIKIVRPITELGAAESIRAHRRAKYEAEKAVNKILRDTQADERARRVAKGVADGTYSIQDAINMGLNGRTIQDIADAYKILDSFRDTIKEQKKRVFWRFDEKVHSLIKDSDSKKSPSSVSLNINTMQRNNERLWGADAQAINEELFDPVIENEAERIRFVTSMQEKVSGFNLNGEESATVQKLMEKKITKEELLANGMDADRLVEAANTLSQMYNDFYEAINDFLVAHGYPEIGFQKNYAPHMQMENIDTLQKYLQRLGFQINVTELPTDLAGRTDTFKPGKQYDPYFQHRKGGKKIVYDAVGGFESYVNYLSNVLYHTDDIMKLRRFSEALRTKYGGEELGAELDRLNALEDRLWGSELLDEDIQSSKEAAYERLGNMSRFGNYVSVLDDFTNILAGKQSKLDRAIESLFGRKILNVGRSVQNAFAKASVLGNLSSAINQTVQIPQLTAELGPKYVVQAVLDVATGETAKADFVKQSDFLTGKRGIQSITEKTVSGKVFDLMAKPFEVVDDFASQVIVRAKYLEQLKSGKPSNEALKMADQYATRLVGSRLRGAKPVVFEQKNMASKLITTFQLEVANGWEHIVHDLPMEIRQIAETKGKRVAARRTAELVVASTLCTFIANCIIKGITGREPVPYDSLGMAANFLASGYGMTKEEYMAQVGDGAAEKVTGKRPFRTDRNMGKFYLPRAAETLGDDVLEDVPFVSNATTMLGITDGRLPVPQVWNDKMGSGIKKLADARQVEDEKQREKALNQGMATVMEGVFSAVTSWAPMGNQIRKTAQGVTALAKGGSYSGYGDSEKLQYPVERSAANITRGVLFGKSALPESDRYYAEGAKTLTERQTDVYRQLVKSGLSERKAYDTIQTLRRAEKTNEAGQQTVKIRLLLKCDLTDEQKIVLYRGLISDSRDDDIAAAKKVRLPFNTFLKAQNVYTAVKNKKPKDVKMEFDRWVDDQILTAGQNQMLKDAFKFWMNIPVK